MATRLTVSVLLLALLSSACASPRVVRLDTGQRTPLEHVPPSLNKSVEVGAEAFEEALTQWVLEAPLLLRSAQEHRLVYATYPGSAPDTRWRVLMSKSFGGLCGAEQRRGNCLSLQEDVTGLSEWDKLGVALGLSLDPLKESISHSVEQTLAPQLFYTVIATGLITWAVLAANPEPIFTKAAAIISALFLIYLGVETFLSVIDASRELKEATDSATTAEELGHAGRRFANRIGPQVARVFILAVTVVVSHGLTGGASFLAARLPGLPGFSEAAAAGAAQIGVNLANVGQVSAVRVVGSNLIISLPSTAVAMTVQNMSAGGSTIDGARSGSRAWGSFSGLKRALGPAREGNQWHHVVEQTPGNVGRFGPEALHNTENVIQLEQGLHRRLSGFYSSIQQDITASRSLTVRQWLSTQSFASQREFGLRAIEMIQKGIWGVWK